MTLDGLITHEFTLEDINDALDLFRSGEASVCHFNGVKLNLEKDKALC